MQLDKYVKLTEEKFEKIFPDCLELAETGIDANHMGYFMLKYRYLKDDYFLIFENTEGVFDIYICDYQNAKSSLYRIKNYNAYLAEDNIEKAILLLKEVLDEKSFDLLIEIDGKMYSKDINGNLKRV